MRLPKLDPDTREATLHLELVELGFLSSAFRLHHDPTFPASESLLMKLGYLETLAYAQSEGHPFQEQAKDEAKQQRVALKIFLGRLTAEI